MDLTVTSILQIVGGLLGLTAFWSLWRIFAGFRLNVYLLNHDSLIQDQTIIPITTTTRRKFIGSWNEDIEITLTDHNDRAYQLNIGYHPWKRFYLNVSENAEIRLNEQPLSPQISYPIRNGMSLKINDRSYEVLVTPRKMFSLFPNEFRL